MNKNHAKNYLLFGGEGGIGSSLALRLKNRGHRVMIAGHTESKVKAAANRLSIPYQIVEATDFDAVDQCVDDAIESMERIDGVVNLVGSLFLKPASITTASEFHDAIDRNLTTAFAVVRSASRVMQQEGGSIVLMSSAAARTGLANHEAIAAAKAGVMGLTMSAAATLANADIRVNAVAPGLVKTPLTENIWSREAAAKISLGYHPLGRFGEPENVAGMIEWLLMPENHWLTGQVIGVDGGLSTVAAAS